MKILTDFPRMAPEMRKMVEERLETGCECGHDTAQLTRRNVRHAVAVYLQCLGCGYALGGALGRQHHYFWQSYPEWDASISDAYQARARTAWQDDGERRREEYARFLATDPRWKELRRRILTRADWLCEACLNARATDVHHVTYTHGRLPPAWDLRAVCRACHDRLHDWQGDAP